MKNRSRQMALGGMLTAVAVVIMSMGSLIPVNTYICPVICMLITRPVLERCGKQIGWCYYLATAILALLLAPDREAAMVYVCLGYYPMLRPVFQRLHPQWLRNAAKLLFFTAAGAASYWLMAAVMGIPFEEGPLMAAVLIILWDALFLLVDRLLGLPWKKKR